MWPTFRCGLRPFPPGLPPIELWVGAQGRRGLALTAPVADGWAAPLATYLPYEQWGPANERIDAVALDAGRHPASIRRIAQLTGTITTTNPSAPVRVGHGAAPIRTTADGWADAQRADGSPEGPFGRVPDVVSLEQACDSARSAARSVIGGVRQAVGDLDRIQAWLTVSGFVNAAPGYARTTAVINAFSEVVFDVFGEDIGGTPEQR